MHFLIKIWKDIFLEACQFDNGFNKYAYVLNKSDYRIDGWMGEFHGVYTQILG